MTSRPKVLVVDDIEENLIALEAILRSEQCDLLRAHSGREALELLLVEDVALALIDVHMPEMDGFDIAELMRGAPRTRSIPIIFVTAALSDQARIFKGYESGAVDFLLKPLDPNVLRSKVEVFLQLYRHKQQLADRINELEGVVSQLRRAEERLKEVDRRKDEFLAVLSHELRNPLMPIRTSLYLLHRVPPGGEQAQRAMAVIERQAGHMARLVDDLLDVTRITRGKFQLQRESADLVEIVRRTVEDHRSAFHNSGVELSVHLARVPLMIEADVTRISQVVGNLLANANKFTPAGGCVRVYLEHDGDYALLRVRDDGVGISPEIMEQLFEPFAQADRTLDRSRGGLGLGLALVKSLTEMHDGSVEVRSDGPGRGAEFVVRLPLAPAPVQAAAVSQESASGGERLHVLIVEDNADGAATLREVVEMIGHKVVVAADGQAAIALARLFKPDVVLCDIGLPGMDGYEVARRFKQDSELCDTRLIALTGYALPEDRQRAFGAGFSDHMAKPPELAELERLLPRPARSAAPQ